MFLSTEYPPETGWGGIGTYTYHMSHELARRGHEVHVLSATPGQTMRHYDDEGVRIHRFNERGLWPLGRIRNGPGFVYRLSKGLATLVSFRRLAVDVDVVEFPEWMAEGLFFPRFVKKPTVAHLHGPLPLIIESQGRSESPVAKMAGYLEGFSARAARVVTAPSESLASWAKKRFGLGERRVFTIPLPLALGPLPSGTPSVATARPHSSAARILIVGRIERRKNPEAVVQAASLILKHFPRAEFVFAGGSTGFREGLSYQEWLTGKADELGVLGQMRFLGHQPQSEVMKLYQNVSLVVNPSRWENFPYALTEAMVAGAPIVASRAGGIPEIVRDGETGLLVDPEDWHGLAQAIIFLLGSPEIAGGLGKRAREDALERFHPARVAAQRESVYRMAMAT